MHRSAPPQSLKRIVITVAPWAISMAGAVGIGLAVLPLWAVIFAVGLFGFLGVVLLMPRRAMAYLIPLGFAFPAAFELPNSATVDSLDIVLAVAGLRLLVQAVRGKVPRLDLTKSRACAIAFIGITVLALLLFSEYGPIQSIWKIYKEARVPSFFFMPSLVLRSRRDVIAQLRALIASATIASAHGILQMVSGDPYFLIPRFLLAGAQEADSKIGVYRHFVPGSMLVRAHSFHLFHNVFAGFLILSISASLALFIAKEGRIKERQIHFVFLSIQIAGFLATFSRAAWVSLIVAWTLALFVLGLIRYTSSVKTVAGLVLFALIVVCLLAIIAPQVVPQRIITIFRPTQQSEFWFRMTRWQAALPLVGRHPILGTGQLTLGDLEGLPSGATPHNGYLFIAVSRGLPALIFFLAVLVSSVRISALIFRGTRERILKTFALASFTALSGFAIHNLWDAIVGDFAVGALYWWTAGTVFWALAKPIDGPNTNAGAD